MPVSIDLTDTDRRDALRAPVSGEKPSLIGMTRDELADALRACGVPNARSACACSSSGTGSMCAASTDFAAMLNISRDLRAALAERFTDRPAGDRRRTDLGRRHPQMAAALSAARRRQAGRDRDRLHSRGRPRHAVHLEPGRLHADLLLLPHRHPEAGAQPDGRGNPVAAAARPRPARRFSRPRHAGRRHRAGRGPQGHQRRHDGHGRTAVQFRRRQEGAADRLRRRGPVAVEAAHHAVDLRRRARDLPHRRGNRRHAGDLAARRATTNCATSWCRSTRNIRSKSCCRPAATIPACPMRGASPSNMSC